MPSILNNAVTVSTTATLLCDGQPRRVIARSKEQ